MEKATNKDTSVTEENKDQDAIDKKNATQENEVITILKEENALLNDKLLRTIAEMENLKKRLERTIIDTREYAIFNFAKDLLSVNDNLTMAMKDTSKNVENLDNIITGIEMTQKELLNILKNNKIEIISPQVGDEFDYNLHHAVLQSKFDDYKENAIVSIMQIGYKIKDRLLRPAMVEVNKK